jgi:hypothetical protein
LIIQRKIGLLGEAGNFVETGQLLDAFAQIMGLLRKAFACLATFAPHGALLQFALHRGCEAHQVGLEDVVTGAGDHGFRRGVFAYGAGNDDEGNILAALPEQREGARAAEMRQRIIRQDDIGSGGQRGKILRFGFHPGPCQPVAGVFQGADHELRIEDIVLDQQNLQ